MPTTIITWNILADTYIRPAYYPNSSAAALDPAKRRALLLERIAKLHADVLCLQEVERHAFDTITRTMPGFDGYWIQKGGGRPDGCATLVARDLSVEEVRELRYTDGSDHVALIVRIDGLFVVNTHLKWDPPATLPGARYGLRETDELLGALRERVNGSRTVVCGDFNVTADDEVVARFIRCGYRDTHEAEDAATCVTNGRARRIDFQLAGSDIDTRPLAVPALTHGAVLPSTTEPSDHVPVGVVIAH
jgi:mRNA deadenylase 3'-5' endonuclease subunit Ccr4